MGLGYPYQGHVYQQGGYPSLQAADYSGIAKALEGLPNALMQSGLNPAVRSQIQYQAALYDKGREDMKKTSTWSPYTTTFGATPTVAPPSAAVLANILPQHGAGTAYVGNEGKEEKKTETKPAATDSSGANVTEKNVYSIGSEGGPAVQSVIRPEGKSTETPSHPQANIVSPFTNVAQANPPSVDQFAISQVPSQVRATTATGEVNPASFATTDTSQLVNQQVRQQQTQPPSPVGDQLMSQWQNQNAHPVAPVSEALKWAKNNFDTRVQDATYMPHGGPLNQPAYAFHMKGGGTNMVPLHQMVQNGFAANVAGNQTSMTLSAADQQARQVAAQQQMQPTGNVGQQQMPQPAQAQQPQAITPTGAPPPAPTDSGAQFAGGTQPLAQGQDYLAQQTKVMTPSGETNPVLSADATPVQRNIANANQKGHDVVYDNPSNAPEATSGVHDHPVLPEEEANYQKYVQTGTPQPNLEVQKATQDSIDKAGGDLNQLPNANLQYEPGIRIASTMPNGVQYYIDPSDPSRMSFRLYKSPPWESHRMYNDGKFTTVVVPNPGGVVEKYLYDHNIDYSGMNPAQKQAAMAQRFWLDLPNYNMDGHEQGELKAYRNRVLQTQRLLKLVNVMQPEEYNTGAQSQQGIAGRRSKYMGIPGVGEAWRWGSDLLTGGTKTTNDRLPYFNEALTALRGDASNEFLTPGERKPVEGLDPDNPRDFKDRILQLNLDAMNQYVRYYDQTVGANHKKGDESWLDTRNQITTTKGITDSQFPDVNKLPAGRTWASPTPAPSASPEQPFTIPRDNSQANPVDIGHMSKPDGTRFMKQFEGKGIWARDARGRVRQL